MTLTGNRYEPGVVMKGGGLEIDPREAEIKSKKKQSISREKGMRSQLSVSVWGSTIEKTRWHCVTPEEYVCGSKGLTSV